MESAARDLLAWHCHRPASGDGLIQAFRRAERRYLSARLRPRGLEAAATGRPIDLDDGAVVDATGRAPMDCGLTLPLETRPTTAAIADEPTP